MRHKQRTEIEVFADSVDCDLYRILKGVERQYDATKRRHPEVARELHKALVALRAARTPLRSLMHTDDVKATA